jgi:hypothetical protein
VVDGQWELVHTHLGFLIKEGDQGSPPTLLLGTRTYVPTRADGTVTAVAPKPELALQISLWERLGVTIAPEIYSEMHSMNPHFATALQCEWRGWDELARALIQENYDDWRRPGGWDPLWGPSDFGHERSLNEAVAYLAWSYWARQLLDSNSDRVRITKRIQGILEDEPRLRTKKRLCFARSLEATFKPSKAKAGSASALIDDLINIGGKWSNGREEPRSKRLADLGFDAVPALIEHLDDPRLTRGIKTTNSQWPFQEHLMVRDVIQDLLVKLAGEKVAGKWRLYRAEDDLGWQPEKADVEVWWQGVHNRKPMVKDK